MTINLQKPDITELKPPHHRLRCRRSRRQRRQQHDRIAGLLGVRVRRRQHRRPGAHHPPRPSRVNPDGSRRDRRASAPARIPKSVRAAADECHRRDPSTSSQRRPHVLHHRRHGRRHRHRCGSGHRPAPPATWVSSPSASSRSRSSSRACAACALADMPASRSSRPSVDTLIVIPNQNLFRVANDRKPPSPTPSPWPTRCSIRALPASPT